MTPTVLETDWLNTEPVFYNELTGKASRNANDVIDFANLEFDPEGFNDFLDYGYSVFNQTPVRDVKFLSASSRLIREEDGRLRVESTGDDRLEERLTRRYTEAEVFELLRARVQEWEASVEGDIVIPTSGGFDSRLLNIMVGDKSRIRSFTYGTSPRQRDSIEVVRARLLAEHLGTRWEFVPLGRFHVYLDEWDALFGPAVHAHGMYGLEFYLNVLARVGSGRPLLSGMCGDSLAGSYDEELPVIHSPSEVGQLIVLSGWDLTWKPSTRSRFERTHTACERYFEENRDKLAFQPFCVAEGVRFENMTLHYHRKVPAYLGYRVESPFTDMDVGTAMLSLAPARRADRLWQQEFFASRGLSLNEAHGSWQNSLNYTGMRLVPLAPLDGGLLAEVIEPDYVRWVNRNVGWIGLWGEGLHRMHYTRGMRRAAVYLRNRGVSSPRLQAYSSYLTLRPIESLLRRRNEARQAAS